MTLRKMDLTGQTIVVVGGSSGVGLAAAELFGCAGGLVTIGGRSKAKLSSALKQLPPKAKARAFDGTIEAEVAEFFEFEPRIDHLIVALGGRAARGHFRELTEERLREAFEAKFWAHMRVLRYALPRVHQSVTIVTGASAVRAFPEMAGVAATNGAINAMIGPLALDLAPLRINAVAPGLIATPYWDSLSATDRDAMYASTAARIPAGRVGTADDIAGAIFFLATNAYTTGTVLPCDGGARHS